MLYVFGTYVIPFKIEEKELCISVEKEADISFYRSEYLHEKEEIKLLTSDSNILINPIEPLNKPKEITPYLLIDFENSFVIGPGAKKMVYITFPVEMGVFISENTNFRIIDILTLSNQKFTLYGDPREGLICKYWKSEVYSSIPYAHPLHEGIIELNITNVTNYWLKVTKAVFNAINMKIYYNNDIVSMKAKMKILSEHMAETDFINYPLITGMKKSLELYTTRKISVITPKFVMESGL